MYDNVMTAKKKKSRQKTPRMRAGRVGAPRGAVEDELFTLTDREMGAAESRWNRPRKRRIPLRVDVEVVEWFQSKGPGYQTRINQILRRS
jgi:uncharacterized protein (DUF4415 family)